MSKRRFTQRKTATTELTAEQKQLELLRKQAAARLLKRRRRKSHQ